MRYPLRFTGDGTYAIGRHTYWGFDLTLRTWQIGERIEIGSFCSIASGVIVHAGGRHRTDFASTFPFDEVLLKLAQKDRITSTTRSTVIGNDVWIGDRVTITGGCRIGHGAVVSAGSVVFGKIPPYAVVGGNPAQVLYYRFAPDAVTAMLRIGWWDWPDEKIIANVEAFYQPVREFIAQFDGGGPK